jgi:hypothetical protein
MSSNEKNRKHTNLNTTQNLKHNHHNHPEFDTCHF